MPLDLKLFGGFRAELAVGQPLAVPRAKAQALLAYLGLHLGEAQPRDKLASLLWPETTDTRSRQSLRQILAVLRRLLDRHEHLLVNHENVALDAANTRVDTVTFERQLVSGSVADLQQATALYRGDLLQGLGLISQPFEEWLISERERLREAAIDALGRLLAHHADAGDSESAIQTALRLLTLDPLQEAVHRTLMRLYAVNGRRSAALTQYQMCVDVLHRELSVAPEPDTKHLYETLLRRPVAPGQVNSSVQDSRSPATSAQPSLPMDDTPFVGRDGELAELRLSLDQIALSRGQTVTILGEAGIGKSRLVRALVGQAIERGCRLLFGQCHESDMVLSFGPWVDAFRFAQLDQNGAALASLHPMWRSELGRLLPEVIASRLPASTDGDRRLFESVVQLLQHLAHTQPLLVVLEDMHWADEMSLRLLAFVSRRIDSRAVYLVATVREDDVDGSSMARRTVQTLSRESAAKCIRLSPLAPTDLARLVQLIAPRKWDAAKLASLEESVWLASEGNPFVAIETLRALQDGQRTANGARVAMPGRVRELVECRLERLSRRARNLLSVAAVIGRAFDFAVLAQASELTDSEAADAVEELVRHRLVRVTGDRLDFCHDRVREVVTLGTLPLRQQLLHASVARAIEHVYATRLDTQDEVLGTHYRLAEVWDRAVLYLGKSGRKSAERSAHRDAVAWTEQALTALGRLPDTPATMTQRIDFSLQLGNSLDALAEYDRAWSAFRSAEQCASRLNDLPRLVRVLQRMCDDLRQLGDNDRAGAVGKRAVGIAGHLGDAQLLAQARFRLSHAYFATGDVVQASELLVAVLDAGGAADEWQVLCAFARIWLAMALAYRGRLSEAKRHAFEADRIADTTADPWMQTSALTALALVHQIAGESHRAISLARRALVLAESRSIIDGRAVIAGILGTAHGAVGQVDDAVSFTEQALSMASEGSRSMYLAILSEAYLEVGRRDDARRSGEEALCLARRQNARHGEARALRALGDIASTGDPPDVEGAEVRFRHAAEIAAELDLRPMIAQCHTRLGRLFCRAGQSEKGASHLLHAGRMFQEMQMDIALDNLRAADGLRL